MGFGFMGGKKKKDNQANLGAFLAESEKGSDSDIDSDDLDEIEIDEIKQWLRLKLKQVEAGYEVKLKNLKPIIFDEARNFIKLEGQKIVD